MDGHDCHGAHGAGDCACHGEVGFPLGHGTRHYLTREEKTAHLETYLEQLKAEAAGVEEEIARLKKA